LCSTPFYYASDYLKEYANKLETRARRVCCGKTADRWRIDEKRFEIVLAGK
jgi:hypothetical protein